MSIWYEAISRAPDRETSQKLLLFWEVEVCRVNSAEKNMKTEGFNALITLLS